MVIQRHHIIYLVFLLLFISCRRNSTAEINGTIDYIGSSTLYIEKKPVHYKYADKIRYPVEPDNRGNFTQSIPLDSQEVVFFTIDDQKYPVVIQPAQTISLSVVRERFPDSVTVEGYPEPWDIYFSEYWPEAQRIQQKIDGQKEVFQRGKSNDVLDLYKHRYKLAKRYLGETPLDIYYYKNVGEYLVKGLEDIKYRRKQKQPNADKERKRIIEKAKNLNFFTVESFKAQRVGILDFANAYANTFGIEDSLEEKYGQELMQHDVKRLGYEKLNAARISILKHIKDRNALAHAKMYLIAERIAEMSPKVAEESYRNYLREFDDFPRYTGFLKSFYAEMKQVSPGNPAVAFTLSNQYGKMVSMNDFRGKYVLLDFWASWCTPCIDEFPHMRSLYSEYNRDQFEIVAISIEKDSLQWRQSLNRFNNPWPQLYGGNGFQQKTFDKYNGSNIPFHILINPEGNIERYNDISPSFNLPKVLDSLLAE